MTVLSVTNQYVEGTVGMKDITSIWPNPDDPLVLPDSAIREIIDSGTYWYIINDLTLRLTASPDEVGVNTFDIEMRGRDRIYTYWRLKNPRDAIREWDYWKALPVVRDGSNVYDYGRKSISESKLVMEVASGVVDIIRDEKAGSPLPADVSEFGIMVFRVPFKDPDGNSFSRAFAIKVSLSSPFVQPSVVDAAEDPLRSIENEYTSPCSSFENLFIPGLSCSFQYNFYEVDESNYETIAERDYTGYKQSDVPKYIELTWDIAPIYVEPVVAITEVAESEELPPESEPGIERRIEEVGVPVEGTSVGSSEPDDSVGTSASDGFVFVPGEGDSGTNVMTEPNTRSFFDAIGTFGFVLGGEAEEAPADGLPGGGIFEDESATENLRETVDPFIGSVPVPSIQPAWLKSGYVGYVILKEWYDQAQGKYIPLDLLAIDGRKRGRVIDWKIAYGEEYRYRIRSVFRYINLYDLSMYKDSDEVLQTSETFERYEKRLTQAGKETYYYDSKSSKACAVSAFEFVRPSPPWNVKMFPNSKERSIFISWNQKNSQRDVKGFNVYRKRPSDGFFTKLTSDLLDIRHNFWVDYDIEFEKEYIYAIESVDIHDNFSDLSVQYWTRITEQNIDILERCEDPQVFWKEEGAPLFGSSEEVQQKRRDNLMYFTEKFNVKINPIYKSSDSSDKFLLKIMSIDSGTKKEIKFKLSTETIYHKVEEKPPPKTLEDRVREMGGQAPLTEGFIGDDFFGDLDFTR